MTYLKAVAGALAIMMASGMIADFDVSVVEDRVQVRIWAPNEENDVRLRNQVTALLSAHIEAPRVIVVDVAA